MKAAAVVLALWCFGSSSWAGEPNAPEVMAAAGFMGRWQQACGRPLSAEDPGASITLNSSGDVIVDFANGASHSRYRVLSAAPAKETGRYALQVIWLGDGRTLDSVYERDGGRWRVMRSAGLDGRLYVENGRLVPEGRPNAWFVRCGD